MMAHKLYHDSHDPYYRAPGGALPAGSRVCLRIYAPRAERAEIRLWWDGHELICGMEKNAMGVFTGYADVPGHKCVLWYYFRLFYPDGTCSMYGNNASDLGGVGEECGHEPPSYQVTVYDEKSLLPPSWMHEAVMYQIFPDRFARSWKAHAGVPKRRVHADWYEQVDGRICEEGESVGDEFYGGDLAGITGKLDHIASLGVTALYLNPIFRAASCHRYDTADYGRIDPMLGTAHDLEVLCAEAKKRGIRVILDGVFSHTGSDSLYFNKKGTYGSDGAYRSRKSPYYKWYTFTDWPKAYECWWGFETLPNVNEDEPSFREYILGKSGIIEKWCGCGISGWRLDVADELPMDFIQDFRSKLKDISPDAALIGEVWEDPSKKVAYGELRCYCGGDTLDSTMNYPLRELVLSFFGGKTDAYGFAAEYRSMQENIPAPFLYAQMNLLGSHDKARAIAVLSDSENMEPERRFRRTIQWSPEAYERGRRRFIAAWKLICALPGMPCLYYGDEAGMVGMTDPFNRAPFPWGREDGQLQREIASINERRRIDRAVLDGGAELVPLGRDVLAVRRFIRNGRDAFGREAADAERIFLFNRSKAPVRAAGREIPPESGVQIV